MTTNQVVVSCGWGLQALSWVIAMTKVGRDAARSSEWGFEIPVRLGVVSLVLWSILAPPGTAAQAGFHPAAVLLMALFLGGHLLATVGRVHLGACWGIGTGRPTASHQAGAVRHGLYRIVRHPIYLGTSVAVLAQLLLLGNLPSWLLLAGVLVINPWKIARENRWLRSTLRE